MKAVQAKFPNGYRLAQLEQTGSTNADALDAAMRGEASGLWISAKRQTSGKGSRGRQWISQEGNLFASLLLRDVAPEKHLPELTFVAALAVRAAIAQLFANSGRHAVVSLKWPNDILIGGKKTSGILLESHMTGDSRAVVIGIGVNCKSHPQEVLHRATDLATEGVNTSAEELLPTIATAFEKYLTLWNKGLGFAAIRREWLAEAAGVGERIFVKVPGRELSGTFEDLADDGNLLLSLDDGSTVRISTADVFFSGKQ